MRILVTGSEGFIGSHLVEKLLTKGYQVRALVQYNSFNNLGWLKNKDNKNLKIILGDVRDESFVEKITKKVDIIINLAALISIPYSYSAVHSYVDTNITGACNIAKAAIKNKTKKLIQISTSEVYGSAKYLPIDENHELQPQSPYSASKIGADAMTLSFYYSFGLNVCLARPFNTYGPRQSLRAVIPTIIYQIIKKKKKIKLGNLESIRDFCHVSDTCEGIISLIKSKNTAGKIFNIGSGKKTKIKDLIIMLEKISRHKITVIKDKDKFRPKKSEVDRLQCNFNKLNSFTGFKPKIKLLDGLKTTYEWYFKNLKEFNELTNKKFF
jgi:NAD dependent epimerase/dehydratase